MIRTFIFILSILTPFSFQHKEVEPFTPIESAFPLHWKTKMGAASFRSNVIVTNQDIIIGSNGEHFKDFFMLDKLSGVYFIDRKTGRIKNHIQDEPIGDMDVNGILLHDEKLYFGNDNEEFFCTTTSGKTLWRLPVSGDIEHEPVLIKNGNASLIVFATECGEVRAVEAGTGKTRWVYYTPGYDGWKPGQNRSILKVKAYFTNTISFYTRPLLYDLNRDGTKDLTYLTNDQNIYAIDGARGTLLWGKKDVDTYSETMYLWESKRGPLFLLTKDSLNNDGNYVSKLIKLDRDGKKIEEENYAGGDSYFGLNAIRLGKDQLLLSSQDAIVVMDADGQQTVIDRKITYAAKNFWNDDTVIHSRNHRHSLLASDVFRYKNQDNCIVVLNQYDFATEQSDGFIDIINLDSKKVIDRFSLPTSSEMPPVVKDINQDGRKDLLISGHDGYLYCYDLGSPD